jgi:hypothetical protein
VKRGQGSVRDLMCSFINAVQGAGLFEWMKDCFCYFCTAALILALLQLSKTRSFLSVVMQARLFPPALLKHVATGHAQSCCAPVAMRVAGCLRRRAMVPCSCFLVGRFSQRLNCSSVK